MLAGTLVSSVGVATAAVPNEAADATSAEKLAKQSGKPIVIGSETTETSQVTANPDGSRTWTNYTHPVRVKQNGAWAAVDLSLVRQADGTLAPKAAPVTMSFTAGGSGSAAKPVARLVKGEAEVGFGWDTDLPPARISGQTATYPDVLPGVDLEVQASLTGFAQNLVVKTAEAAKNPKLKKVTFKSHTKNTKISNAGTAGAAAKSAATSRADGLVVTGPDGNQVFSGDASRMWDSAEAARQGVMGVEVGADTISVTPDQAFLADPNTTYPVRLDPDYTCTTCGKQHHAVVQSPADWANSPNYDKTDGQLGDLKAGYLNKASLGAKSNGISRTYLQLNTSELVGKKINSATLHADVISSYACTTASPTELWLTKWIDQNTTWNNQPGWEWGGALSENNKVNNPGHCPTDGGADFDAMSAVVAAANGSWTTTTFMLKAKNEADLDNSWRRFNLNPYLVVKYNSYPGVPADMGIEGWGPNKEDALPCVTGVNRPHVGTRTPRVRARLSDPDGGFLNAGFQFYGGIPSTHPWSGPEIYVDKVQAGSFAEVRVPESWTLGDGIYTFFLRSGDGQLPSPPSPDCEFVIDTVAPNKPAVASTDYPTTGFNGSVGRTGNFTFSPNGNTGPNGSMDVVRYGWSLNVDTIDNQVNVSEATGVVNVPITPMQAGTNTLYVQAYDKAGNRAAAPQTYVFNVADPAAPVAAWNFDETGGTTAADSTGKGHPLTLNGATFGSGYAGNGQVNTTSSFSSASSAVVDTSKAFSVSAWAKLDNTGAFYSVASQDGTRGSGFYLQYNKTLDRWVFNGGSADTDTPVPYRAVSAAPPQTGVWTHLLGTYEPNSHKLSLYVNGKLEGTADGTLWNAPGQFVVGAAKWLGGRVDQVEGTIDHVQVWDRAVSAAEAANQNNFVVLRARYNLDEREGTTTKDEVTRQNGTLSGGVSWAGTPADPDDPNQILTSKDKWLKFDSSETGQVAGPHPVNLRTDRSYTVSAWVRHSGFDNAPRAAVGMGDNTFSPFLLGYRPETGKWSFLLTHTPSGGGSFALSDVPAEANKWVHLAATFDATTGTITLYVNGIKQHAFSGDSTSGTGLQAFNGSGEFWIGRGLWDGHRSDPWKGDIDDARIYSGVSSAQNITDMYLATKHF
ncbi:LamG-like jellyroll fold domain-containing protein [Lentzea aerocolonigenes]|uniref:LamG-like jellyroll fold domain-containing protein n=1 Tax=Lentzea aerocolonigenes TaxID=68170 RepID=UPI0006975DD4|nr:LamG-like jellyroll fold domain-containing protein [Lentzea aerocolonigenes]